MRGLAYLHYAGCGVPAAQPACASGSLHAPTVVAGNAHATTTARVFMWPMRAVHVERFLIVGSGGREAAFARGLAADSAVCAVMNHANPFIIECAEKTGGAWAVESVTDPKNVAGFAKRHDVDYAFVSADEPLAAGVVDGLLAAGIRAVGATKNATRIESNKIWSAELVGRACPGIMPFSRPVYDEAGISSTIDEFRYRNMPVVVKPQGLTGGKGVKVMGPHLDAYSDCAEYAASLLRERPGEGVLLVERLDGIEFTVMGLTDGRHLVMSPASYDYPYRHEGDTGPGTGGMGCFTGPDKALPFMSAGDLRQCRRAMEVVIREMARIGVRFTGVLNGGFFLTRDGIRFMEFNARFGDPEGINILQVLRTPLSDMVRRMWHGTLERGAVRFARKASVVKYLVGPEYPSAGRRLPFKIDMGRAADLGASVWTAACIRDGGSLLSLGRSRAAAVGAVADTIPEASAIVEGVIASSDTGGLEHRSDIGSEPGLRDLSRRAEVMRTDGLRA